MRSTYLATLLLSLLTINACSPTYDWRDVRVEATPLLALFPCKPEPNTRDLSLGGQNVKMTLLGCETGGASFVLVNAKLNNSTTLDAISNQWRQATLANIQAHTVKESFFSIKTGPDAAKAFRVSAQGVRPDGTAMHLQGVWFAIGTHIFQATVVSNQANAANADAFFEGLRAP